MYYTYREIRVYIKKGKDKRKKKKRKREFLNLLFFSYIKNTGEEEEGKK